MLAAIEICLAFGLPLVKAAALRHTVHDYGNVGSATVTSQAVTFESGFAKKSVRALKTKCWPCTIFRAVLAARPT
jgi:hypothetical protein